MSKELFLQNEPKLELAGRLRVAIWIFTVVVFLLVGAMRRPEKIPLPEGVSLSFLPAVHATLNTLVAVFLVTSLVMIKRGLVKWHQAFVSVAMVCSALFLVCYVAYHFTTAETHYGGEGVGKLVYRGILISHIIAAGLSLPFILLTWMYGYTNQFEKHRNMAKWVFPVWLYVAITGPICYLMLRPYY